MANNFIFVFNFSLNFQKQVYFSMGHPVSYQHVFHNFGPPPPVNLRCQHRLRTPLDLLNDNLRHVSCSQTCFSLIREIFFKHLFPLCQVISPRFRKNSISDSILIYALALTFSPLRFQVSAFFQLPPTPSQVSSFQLRPHTPPPLKKITAVILDCFLLKYSKKILTTTMELSSS